MPTASEIESKEVASLEEQIIACNPHGFGERAHARHEAERLADMVQEINDLEPEFEELTDEELASKTDEYRERFRQAMDEFLRVPRTEQEIRDYEEALLDELLPEAFATVREASRRELGMRHYDVQLVGGILLHEGRVAEMRTGEGKTLVAPLALYLNAISGRGSHLVTANDYLAQVDAGWMGRIYERLGMTTAVLTRDGAMLYDSTTISETPHSDDRLNHFVPTSRHNAYHADIIYTTTEIGFDHLRDHTISHISLAVQGELNFCVIDEVDNILIDQARTPLILTEPSNEEPLDESRFVDAIGTLVPGQDYRLDEKRNTVYLTTRGIRAMEQALGIPQGQSLYDLQHLEQATIVDIALRARTQYTEGKDYVVRDGRVLIIDKNTGHLMHDRRFPGGIHEALELQHGVPVQQSPRVQASITLPHFFGMYHKLAGMTGTARAVEAELSSARNKRPVDDG